MRLTRRKLLQGYIKVPEVAADGRKHLHILFRGSYIEQAMIKAMWENIHQSSIVDIRLVRTDKNPKRVAAYMAKYMTKELAGRYAWSWGWVWRGFCRDWTTYKRWYWKFLEIDGVTTFKNLLYGWDCILTGKLVANFPYMSEQVRNLQPFNHTDCFPLHVPASALAH